LLLSRSEQFRVKNLISFSNQNIVIKMTDKINIVWFRQDLRISDNPALFEAVKNGAVLPIYILDEQSAGSFKDGAASRWWLHNSLTRLNESLENKLNIYCGDAQKIIPEIIAKNNVGGVYWNRCYEPWRIKQDTEIKAALKAKNIECKSFNGSLLWEPWEILKDDKTYYKVFTPFYRNGCLKAAPPRQPLQQPENLILVKDQNAINIAALKLMPKIKWYKQMEKIWEIGEKAAQEKLQKFLNCGLNGYKEGRNFPAEEKTSRLSPYLHFGEISPNQVWYAAKNASGAPLGDIDHFLSELGWREFSNYLLYHFPELPNKNFQAKFEEFPWQENKTALKAWQKGQTGFPIIDAGMRELWQTGYIHNRVRMAIGSFLVKNLLLHWQLGERWFWDCLLDADLANNCASWQWVAGSGADAAPYFRIFNPVLQGEKFDAAGLYTRHFVPELKNLPDKFLYKPWEAPQEVLRAAGVILGKNYPNPIIDLKSSRDMALLAYRHIQNKSDLF
jgi:deoxyribodipyrimidine photo-lyase